MLAKVFIALSAAAAAATSSVSALEVGDYYRPSGDEVSGFAGTTAVYRRSPCPALNTLANHGYLARNGQNITSDALSDALTSVYNLDLVTAQILVNQVPSSFSLDYLGTHNLLEHDASLTHRDFYYGDNPMSANATLADDFFARADATGRLGLSAVASTRRDRADECHANNPECKLTLKNTRTAFLEASVLLLVLGGGDSISVEHAQSFIVDEKFPDDWTKPMIPVTVAQVLATTSTLITLSLVS